MNLNTTLNQLKEKTIEIMNILSIDVRQNVHLDGELTLNISSTLDDEVVAHYTIYSNQIFNKDLPLKMYYGKSAVEINAKFQNPLEKNDFSCDTTYVKAAIIHELVHYYQVGAFDEMHGAKYIQAKPDKSNIVDYASQKCEFEAHTVQSYYYLSIINKPNLDIILIEPNENTRNKRMIDFYNQIRGRNKFFHC